MDGRRLVASRVLVVLAAAALLAAVVVGYAQRAGVDADQFSDRATAALQDDSVKTLLADEIADQVIAQEGDLLAARPIIEGVAVSVVGGSAFRGVYRAAIRDVHRAVLDRDQHTVTLTVADVGTLLAAGLDVLRPSLAAKVRAAGTVELVQRDIGTASARAVRVADVVRVLAVLLVVLTLVLAGGALVVAVDRRRAVVDLGVGAAVAGVVVVVAYGIARGVAVREGGTPEARAAIGGVWDAFLGDLRVWGWVLGAAGAIVAAAAASVLRPVERHLPVARVVRWMAVEPERPWARAARGVALVVAGVLLLTERDWLLQVAFALGGVYVLYLGVTALLRLIARPVPAGGVSPARDLARDAVDGPAPEAVPVRRHVRPLVPAAVAVVLVAAVAGGAAGTGAVSASAPPAREGCNGHPALCDRRLDEVALPATHNSMSVPLPGWFSAEQDHPIARQLADGVRGLLIDTHYADKLPNGRLRTEIGDTTAQVRAAEADGVPRAAIDAALRTRDRLGFAGRGQRGVYLCHSFCELGGTPLDSVLRDVRDFLVAHPDEVLVIVNQDAVAPADVVAAFRRAGLEKDMYKGPTAAGRWWTLRKMIDTGQRVVLLAEEQAGGAPWYQKAYDSILQETPYAFGKPAQLTDPAARAASCAPNRGPATAGLFLVNHWVTTDPLPRPSQASTVNAYNSLLARLEECRTLRHHIPNLVAVNFYARGDLFRAVDALNGV